MASDADEAQRRREECERKARRGEMDPRLEFTFQLLIDATQLPRHQLMDYIFEGDMVSNYYCLYKPFSEITNSFLKARRNQSVIFTQYEK